jgi:hypothetical protein
MYQMPAIEWDEKVIDGTSSIGSPVITGITDTSDIEVGATISSIRFPYRSFVLSKDSNSVTMSENATANFTGNFSFFRRYEFEFPATEDQGEQSRADQSVSKSLSGNRQVVTNHIELTREVTFGLSQKLTVIY